MIAAIGGVIWLISLGGSVYDPTDAVGRLLFNVLALVAEFESDVIRLRNREGIQVACSGEASAAHLAGCGDLRHGAAATSTKGSQEGHGGA